MYTYKRNSSSNILSQIFRKLIGSYIHSEKIVRNFVFLYNISKNHQNR